MKTTIKICVLFACLVLVGCNSTHHTHTATPTVDNKTHDSEVQLKEHIINSHWQWDGDSGEEILFKGNGYVEHPGWIGRRLVTRWEVIDRRTVLLEIESGRTKDIWAVLVFSDDISSFTGFNFHGGSRIVRSLRLDK